MWTLPSAVFVVAVATKHIGPCIGGLMQDAQHIVVLNGSRGELSLMGSTADSSWKEQALLVKVANRGKG